MGRWSPATYTSGSGEPNNLGGENTRTFYWKPCWNDHQITYTVPFTMQLDKVANSSVSCYGEIMDTVTAAGGTTI